MIKTLKNKKNVITLITLSILLGCKNQSDKDHFIDDDNKTKKVSNYVRTDSAFDQNEWNYQKVNSNNLDSLVLNICLIQDSEFIDLYPILDSITSQEYEKLTLVGLLKSKGFEVINWGYGNWLEGPRIVNFKITNKQCECQVDKLYYWTDNEGFYKVTERIKCEANK